MPTLENSGTITTDGTEQTVDTRSGVQVYMLFIDLANMVAGDAIEIRTYYTVLNAGTERLLFPVETFVGVQSPPIWHSIPIPSNINLRFTIKRIDGTDRGYAWKVLSL